MHDEAASPRHREARSASMEVKLSSKADIELEVSPAIFTAAREAHEKTKCASPTVPKSRLRQGSRAWADLALLRPILPFLSLTAACPLSLPRAGRR